MKHKFLIIGLAVGVYSISGNADTLDKTKSSTQPGVHLDQSKNVLFEQFSSYSFSLQTLQAKNTFNNYDLIIGGSLQTDYQRWHGHTINEIPPRLYKEGKGLYFTQAVLDAMGNVSHWVTSFLSVADSYIGRPSEEGNDVFLNRAILIFGDVDKFPIYATVGINTLPFGVFSGSGVWDTPLTGAYFNPALAPQISLAYYKNGLNISVTKYSDQTNHQNHNVGSVYYNKSIANFNFSLGAGYLTDLKSNSTGTSLTHRKRKHALSSGFNYGLVKDVNASIGYKRFSISGEYVQGSDVVGINVETPHATAFTATYIQSIAGKDVTFGITRSHSYHLKDVPVSLAGEDALPLTAEGLESAWGVSISSPILTKNSVLGVNFEKSVTYSAHSSYTGTLELYLYL
ncbi:MAG: DUF3573 domain-containing protein [Gammaproteobacteria bacterium]|nr:DUF3573 domain-containing protein [Gammaproteobacteria bacterium]